MRIIPVSRTVKCPSLLKRLWIFASPLNRYFLQINLTNRIYLYIGNIIIFLLPYNKKYKLKKKTFFFYVLVTSFYLYKSGTVVLKWKCGYHPFIFDKAHNVYNCIIIKKKKYLRPLCWSKVCEKTVIKTDSNNKPKVGTLPPRA